MFPLTNLADLANKLHKGFCLLQSFHYTVFLEQKSIHRNWVIQLNSKVIRAVIFQPTISPSRQGISLSEVFSLKGLIISHHVG